MSETLEISDLAQRAAAIDPTRSFIVQAPAGSGKTELLIQRFLALLGRVDRPQRVLAITFTRKAAAEMRTRLYDAFAAAQSDCPREPHKKLTWQLARKVLEQDRARSWGLLDNPSMLSIQTIDSFNAGLVNKMPWLSRFGGVPELTEDADSLYLQAAENLLARLETEKPGGEQVARLLAHLDNRMERLQQMLLEMLRKRDQWLRHLLGIKGSDSRELLEQGLHELLQEQLQQLTAATPEGSIEELLFCGRYAASQLWDQGDRPLLSLTDLDWFPGASVEHLPIWQGIADLLLTGKGDLRKPRGVNKNCGFPTGGEGAEAKQRMQQLLTELADYPEFIRLLGRCRELPTAEYQAEQWQILQALIELLPLLVAELWLVFRGEGKADFAEIALKAREALNTVDDPSDLLLKLDSQLEHILVDEFQDTSWLQYQLLETLTSGWQAGDGRTLFLVGDPMQSIYRFREAEVGLFLRTFSGRFGTDGPELEPLQLRCNFRSQKGVVDWVNQCFSGVFPEQLDIASGAVPLATADAVHPVLAGVACQLYPQNGRNDVVEAEQVLQLVAAARQQDPRQSVAILVRSRSHLAQILPLLRKHGYPYQAQDIELLGEQPAVSDIVSLTRALLHRADRLAWLSVLRAPWAALRLEDLHALVDDAPYATIPSLLQHQSRLAALSAEGQSLLTRIWPILGHSLSRRGRIGVRQLVENCWLALGGPACYDAEGLENAALVFDLIETLQEGGDLPSFALLEERLAKLFASPDTSADGSLQVMTIHKAKGLEFDQVILPGLGRKPRGAESPLLRWLEHPESGLLLAPIAPRDGSEQDPIYKLIGQLEKEKQELETGRLLYVAATRAKKYLHLLGHADESSKGELRPARGSLLETLWPVLESEFTAKAVIPAEEAEPGMQLLLRRLPLDWQMPRLQSVPLPKVTEIYRPSDQDSEAEDDFLYSGWEHQTQRHIGTLVHNVLEMIAKQGVDCWQRKDPLVLQRAYLRQLVAMGVPSSEAGQAVHLAVNAIEKTLSSDTGKWLLQDHEQAACELSLTGLVAGKKVPAIIDRTFVDEQGVRWVIDYKISQPKEHEADDVFFRNKEQQYSGQLSSYKQLLAELEPGRTIRTALYFPLIDGWCEIAC